MEIELNRFYKTRVGKKAQVVYINASLHKHHKVYALLDGENILKQYDLGGRFADFESSCDLIAPWEEPKPPRKLYAYKRSDGPLHEVVFFEKEDMLAFYPKSNGLTYSVTYTRLPEYDIEYPGGE